MRITKKYLQSMIDSAEAFQRCEILFVGKKDAHKVYDQPGFTPPEQYAGGAIPMKSEIGRVGSKRFVCEQLKRWAP